MGADLDFVRDGAQLHRGALPSRIVERLRALADERVPAAAGARLYGEDRLADVLGRTGPLGLIARAHLGQAAAPVRALLFDKTSACNWAVAWHQDRTIAVRTRVHVHGFGPWSMKDGAAHVAPPFEILAGMATLRAHLDDCDPDNAPLLIAPGSHRFGIVPAADAARRAEELGVYRCLGSLGDVWAYSTPILHASERAAKPRRRRVLQVDFATRPLPDELQWLGVC